jgi:hypothetical protein
MNVPQGVAHRKLNPRIYGPKVHALLAKSFLMIQWNGMNCSIGPNVHSRPQVV